jgi:hypothetical protein
MIKFASGLAIGVLTVFAVQWYGPDNIKQNATDGYAAAEEQVDEFRAGSHLLLPTLFAEDLRK